MFLTVIMEGICEVATVLSVLMEEYTVTSDDRYHINVMLVLQSCTDSLKVLQGSSSEKFPSSSDGTLDIGNIKVEEHIDIKREEEELNVKTEKVIGSEEEECIDIKDEDGIYGEEKEEEEDMATQEEENVDIEEEVSCEDTV